MNDKTKDQIAAIMSVNMKEAIEYCSIVNKTTTNACIFGLTDKQYQRAIEWEKTHECTIGLDEFGHKILGAIGGGLSYCFTPTGLGIIEVVSCACGAKLNLTEFEDW